MSEFNEEAFHAAIDAWRPKQFDRATCNCYHFAADIIERATGQKFEVPPTQDEEAQFFERTKNPSLWHTVLQYLGKPRAALEARIGDLVYRKANAPGVEASEATLGIADRGFAWFLGKNGLEVVKLSSCAKSFRTY